MLSALLFPFLFSLLSVLDGLSETQAGAHLACTAGRAAAANVLAAATTTEGHGLLCSLQLWLSVTWVKSRIGIGRGARGG